MLDLLVIESLCIKSDLLIFFAHYCSVGAQKVMTASTYLRDLCRQKDRDGLVLCCYYLL
jgi:hypothetical protein